MAKAAALFVEKEKSVEDIAREAAVQIIGITDTLIERQKREEVTRKED